MWIRSRTCTYTILQTIRALASIKICTTINHLACLMACKINDIITINSDEVFESSGGNSIIILAIVILCLLPFLFVLSLQLSAMSPYVPFHATMMTLNISKHVRLVSALSIFFKPLLLLLPILHVTKTSDCEEDPCDFLLISSFHTLLLARSILITPFGAELNNDILNVYQEFDNVPSKHKP
jgi:hypothetical protein